MNTLSSDLKLLTVEMKEGFKRMDELFLTQDKRFNQIFAYFTTGIVILWILITVFGLMG